MTYSIKQIPSCEAKGENSVNVFAALGTTRWLTIGATFIHFILFISELCFFMRFKLYLANAYVQINCFLLIRSCRIGDATKHTKNLPLHLKQALNPMSCLAIMQIFSLSFKQTAKILRLIKIFKKCLYKISIALKQIVSTDVTNIKACNE